MTTKQVTVTKYVSCDGIDFNTRSECEAHELNIRSLANGSVCGLRSRMQKLRCEINEARIKARLAWLDAQKLKPEARSAMGKSQYCELMAQYWAHTSTYNSKRVVLREVRRKIDIETNSLYKWFGLYKNSSVSRHERMERSKTWRDEHTPDQWRSPYKIRVSKQPKATKGER